MGFSSGRQGCAGRSFFQRGGAGRGGDENPRGGAEVCSLGYLVTNFVTNLVMNLVTNLVNCKVGDNFGDEFSDEFGELPN